MKGVLAGLVAALVALPVTALGGPPAEVPDREFGGKVERDRNHHLRFNISGQGGTG